MGDGVVVDGVGARAIPPPAQFRLDAPAPARGARRRRRPRRARSPPRRRRRRRASPPRARARAARPWRPRSPSHPRTRARRAGVPARAGSRRRTAARAPGLPVGTPCSPSIQVAGRVDDSAALLGPPEPRRPAPSRGVDAPGRRHAGRGVVDVGVGPAPGSFSCSLASVTLGLCASGSAGESPYTSSTRRRHQPSSRGSVRFRTGRNRPTKGGMARFRSRSGGRRLSARRTSSTAPRAGGSRGRGRRCCGARRGRSPAGSRRPACARRRTAARPASAGSASRSRRR